LFERLTQDDLKEDVKIPFGAIKEANRLYSLALMEVNLERKIDLLGQAINLNRINADFFIARSETFIKLKNYDQAIADLMYVLSIS
jgi:hypothetical protein